MHLGRGWIEVSTTQIRRFAGDAIAAQAILSDTLALILKCRYGEEYMVPEWVITASRNDYIWQQFTEFDQA